MSRMDWNTSLEALMFWMVLSVLDRMRHLLVVMVQVDQPQEGVLLWLWHLLVARAEFPAITRAQRS